MERNYKVSYSIDYLDPNPTIKYFDEWYEMQDWIIPCNIAHFLLMKKI